MAVTQHVPLDAPNIVLKSYWRKAAQPAFHLSSSPKQSTVSVTEICLPGFALRLCSLSCTATSESKTC